MAFPPPPPAYVQPSPAPPDATREQPSPAPPDATREQPSPAQRALDRPGAGRDAGLAAGDRPSAPTEGGVTGRVVSTAFAKFLRYRVVELTVARSAGPETVRVGVLSGPGHDVASVGALALDAQGRPQLLFKTGDTRASRVLRGDDYVKLGFVAGRLDHAGAGPAEIALAEISEEVGGEVVPGSFRPLGAQLSPTMPFESTEADAYYTALVKVGKIPSGDGGGMELPGLIGPLFAPVEQAMTWLDDGTVADGSRGRVVFARALDSLGYVWQLGLYAQDVPALRQHFQTLGLGDPRDPRSEGSQSLEIPPAARPSESVNTVIFEERTDVPVWPGMVMVDARTRHAQRDSEGVHPVGEPFANQLLTVDYDRAKVAVYYLDPAQGPMVCMTPVERPVLAAKAVVFDAERLVRNENTDLTAEDVLDLRISRRPEVESELLPQLPPGARLEELGAGSGASSGQTDLYYRFFAAEVGPSAVPCDSPADHDAATPSDRAAVSTRPEPPAASQFVPLAEALRRCRKGQGDAQTEALLLRLADRLGWIPTLGMSLESARALLK